MQPKDQVLEVWGDYACFTRPEMKVERFSYPVITPSAARGIYDAIYCKPNREVSKAEFRWQVTMVEMLLPPSFIAFRRNEVKDKASIKESWVTGKELPQPIAADGTKEMLGNVTKGRTQRQTMALKNVRYRLHAEIRPWPGYEDRLQAMEAQFRRRASHGKCIYQPYFGCREFPAFFELVDPGAPEADRWEGDLDIGIMLYDVFDLTKPGTAYSNSRISVFKSAVKQGVMLIPDYESEEVLRAVGGDASD